MNSQVEQVAADVTQADRDAVADYLFSVGWDWGACGDVREGRVAHPAVQAFARHRLASLASQPPVLDEREVIPAIIRDHNPKTCGEQWPLNAADAILATLSHDPVLLGEVRQALEPFAELADAVDAGSWRIFGFGILAHEPGNTLTVGGTSIRSECTITIGALIAARDLLAKLPKLTGEEV